jgi:hypothetical protein
LSLISQFISKCSPQIQMILTSSLGLTVHSHHTFEVELFQLYLPQCIDKNGVASTQACVWNGKNYYVSRTSWSNFYNNVWNYPQASEQKTASFICRSHLSEYKCSSTLSVIVVFYFYTWLDEYWYNSWYDWFVLWVLSAAIHHIHSTQVCSLWLFI